MTFLLLRRPRTLVHGGVLVTTGWLLIATSAPDEPARDCFEGLPKEATLRVTLGELRAGEGAAGAAGASSSERIGYGLPSCGDVDGVVSGRQLVIEVRQGERDLSAHGACYGYDLLSVSPVEEVTLSDEPHWGVQADVFAGARGGFTSARLEGCRGGWSLTFGPVEEVAKGTVISPLDAGDSEEWYLIREMTLAQAQFCDDAMLEERGVVACEDVFRIERIEEVTP